MGWYDLTDYSRKDIIEECTRTYTASDLQIKCLKKCMRGNVLWAVWERTPLNDSDVPFGRFLECFLLRSSDIGWGYKSAEESMGPCYYTCPLSYLELANEGINENWRRQVRYHHRRRLAHSRRRGGSTIQFCRGGSFDIAHSTRSPYPWTVGLRVIAGGIQC